jgi:hypothetical protein
VRVTLDGEEIPFRIEPDDGMALADVPYRVILLDAGDYDRAREAVDSIQRNRFGVTSDDRPDRVLRYTLYAIAGMTLLGFIMCR